MKIEVDDELIVKYLSGEASPEEAMALHGWLEDPVNLFHFNGLQKTWNASYPGKSPRPVNIEKAWSNVEHMKRREERRTVTPIVFGQKTFLKIAASIILVVSIGVTLYLVRGNATAVDIAVESRDSIRQLTLTDQSQVTLFRNSSFTYPDKFAKQREVQLLNGEAFFDISHDKTKPFIVHTPLAAIKVLGTAFNVLQTADRLEISVDEGRVLAYTATDSVYLQAGEAASLRAGTEIFVIHQSNSNAWAYATHKYVFNNTSLREVFDYVEKAQNCEIRMSDSSIGNCKLTATFESVSTEYMLTLITEALNLSVTKNDNDTFTVEGEGCH
jgi:ferric-dicitrate binding protein FerR (iron transport regulator)